MTQTDALSTLTSRVATLGLGAALMLTGCADTEEEVATIGWDLTAQNVLGMLQSDVEVCTAVGCSVSDGSGELHVELPVGESTLIAVSDGIEIHQNLTIVDTPPAPNRVLVMNQAMFELITEELPEQDPALGMVIASNVFEAGHAVELNVDADGPYYVKSSFTGVDMDAEITSAAGLGLFLNVPIGEAQVSFTPPEGRTCLATPWMQAGDSADSSRVQVAANVIVTTELDCRE